MHCLPIVFVGHDFFAVLVLVAHFGRKKFLTVLEYQYFLVRLVPVLTDEQKKVPGARGVFYTTKKNPRMEGGFEGTGKLRLKKYHSVLQLHLWFVEKKIK